MLSLSYCKFSFGLQICIRDYLSESGTSISFATQQNSPYLSPLTFFVFFFCEFVVLTRSINFQSSIIIIIIVHVHNIHTLYMNVHIQMSLRRRVHQPVVAVNEVSLHTFVHLLCIYSSSIGCVGEGFLLYPVCGSVFCAKALINQGWGWANWRKRCRTLKDEIHVEGKMPFYYLFSDNQ